MVNWNEFLKAATNDMKDDKWNFDKFKICCSKCNSFNVECNGECECDHGYYPGEEGIIVKILVKCHACGNAMIIDTDEDIKLFDEVAKPQ